MKKVVFVLAMLAAVGANAATEKNKKVQNIYCNNSGKECGVVVENRLDSAQPNCFLNIITIPNGGVTDKTFIQSTLSILLAAKASGQTVTIDFNVLASGRCEMTGMWLGTTL